MNKQERLQNNRGWYAYNVFNSYMGHYDPIPFSKIPEDEKYAWIGMANSVVYYDRIFWNKAEPLNLPNRKLNNIPIPVQFLDSDSNDSD